MAPGIDRRGTSSGVASFDSVDLDPAATVIACHDIVKVEIIDFLIGQAGKVTEQEHISHLVHAFDQNFFINFPYFLNRQNISFRLLVVATKVTDRVGFDPAAGSGG